MNLVVAFDWNGTIVSDVERAAEATSTVLLRRGLPPLDVQAFRGSFRLPLSSFFGHLGIPLEDLQSAEDEWNTAMRATTPRLADGVTSMLAELTAAGVRLGVISAASAETVLADAASLGIADSFDFILGAQEDKSRTLQNLGGDPGSLIVYIGDTEHDITSATRADAIAIGYSQGYRPGSALTQSGAHTVIDSMHDLIPALEPIITPRLTPAEGV